MQVDDPTVMLASTRFHALNEAMIYIDVVRHDFYGSHQVVSEAVIFVYFYRLCFNLFPQP